MKSQKRLARFHVNANPKIQPIASDEWKRAVISAAKKNAVPGGCIGPLMVSLTFFLLRPKSHYEPGEGARALRPDAPKHHVEKPDTDELVWLTIDALTEAGAWKDRAQVTRIDAHKLYDDRAFVFIQIETADYAP